MATKYTFVSEDDAFGYPSQKVVVEVKTVALNEVVEAFERFLRGSGFVFDGQLEFVDPETSLPYDGPEFPSTMYDEQDVMPMPGTMGGAAVTFKEQNDKCAVCGLTNEQLGGHKCYDQRCGLK